MTPESPPPRDLEMAQLEELERMTPVRRPIGSLVGILAIGAVLSWLCWHDPAVWRKGVLAGMVVLLLGLSLLGRTLAAGREHRRRIQRRPGTTAIERVLGVISALVLSALVFSAGGFDGPLLPMAVPLCFVAGVLGPPRQVLAMGTTMIALIWAAALVSAFALVPDLMPAVFGGGPNVPQSRALLFSRAAAFTLMVLWASAASAFVRKLYQSMLTRALDARDEALRNHADHTRTLTTLSGEIAHELKNPLASVKGLATLVEREVTGKLGERMAVLRREVERMEEILDGFLNFSRPLLPLQQEVVSPAEVCAAVVQMHEGLALQRGVALTAAEGEPLSITCDRRKIKQVLINLVQNALEASPSGATIELGVAPAGDGGAIIEVRDRGPGVSLQVQGHLFEPGVTTKGTGSGLGLALARGLARQHGGELTLGPRPGGGCVAALTLPGASR